MLLWLCETQHCSFSFLRSIDCHEIWIPPEISLLESLITRVHTCSNSGYNNYEVMSKALSSFAPMKWTLQCTYMIVVVAVLQGCFAGSVYTWINSDATYILCMYYTCKPVYTHYRGWVYMYHCTLICRRYSHTNIYIHNVCTIANLITYESQNPPSVVATQHSV